MAVDVLDSPDPTSRTALLGMPLSADSPFYVSSAARHLGEQADLQAVWATALMQPGALVRIRGAWKYGKTSLLYRQQAWARQQAYLTAYVDLETTPPPLLEQLDDFLQWFCAQVAASLDWPSQLDEYWDDLFGSSISCKSYFEEYLLPQAEESALILALDNVDCLFAYPDLADEFFGLLRAWHEEAKTRPLWQQLRLVVTHSPEVYTPRNINKSPFNVGVPIELHPLTPSQVQQLAQQYELTLTSEGVRALLELTGGQPYLCQLGLDLLTSEAAAIATEETLTAQLQCATDSVFYPHLQQLEQALHQQPSLKLLLDQVLAADTAIPLDLEPACKLQSLGLVTLTGQTAQISCTLYSQYFSP